MSKGGKMNTFTIFGWEIVPGYDISLAAWWIDFIILGIVLAIAAGLFCFFFFLGWMPMTKEEKETFGAKRAELKTKKGAEKKEFLNQQSKPTRRMLWWKRAQKVIIPVTSIVVVIAMLGAPLLYSYGPQLWATLFYKDNTVVSETSKLAAKEATENVVTIEREGIVMLKNDGVLPFKVNEEEDAEKTKINIFGMDAFGIFYGNGGSGEFATNYTYDKGTAKERTLKSTKLEDALESVGFEYNPYLKRLYQNFKNERTNSSNFSIAESNVDITASIATFGTTGRYLGIGSKWLPYEHEPGIAAYDEKEYDEIGGKTLIEQAKSFSDKVVFCISRFGTESAEMTEAQLNLMQNERDLLELLVDEFDTKNIVVLLNTPGPIFLTELIEDFGIKAIIHMGHPGLTGATAVAEVIAGKVNPSGRTVDTWPVDLHNNPTYETFGQMSTRFTGGKTYPFSNYYEGIYVGYRYYTTRAVEDKDFKYEDEVYYSFGHGLSYTTFNVSLVKHELDLEAGTAKLYVDVENTGTVPGKYVIEVYNTAPYYKGGIEKAAYTLIAYQKTNELKPEELQRYEIDFNIRDLASWDTKTGCYNLEHGTYQISLKENAWDFVTDAKHNRENFFTFDIESDVIYQNSYQTGHKYENIFQDVEYGGNEEPIQYLSRADFEGTYTRNEEVNKTWNNDIEIDNNSNILRSRVYEDNTVDESKVAADLKFKDDSHFGRVLDEPITLHDMKDAEWDDPRWSDFLDQLSIDDCKNLIGGGDFATPAIKSIDKPNASEGDGPASCYNSGTGHPSGVILASTWWNEAALLFGRSCAKEGAARGITGWYAPGMNIHRSPYAGRNFEYYSEDPLIAGNMGGYTAVGALDFGVYSFAKHYGLNEQEINRNGLNVFCSEQGIREVYLKPYEIYSNLGGTGMMSAFSSMGTTWAGASDALCNKLLRDEWGFKGSVITDYNNDSMPCSAGLRAGNDEWLIPALRSSGSLNDAVNKTPTDMRYYMRKACKNILYSLAHSNNAWDEEDFEAAGIEFPR